MRQSGKGLNTLKVETGSSQHYNWGESCDGWVLSPTPDQLVLEERMPPDTSERRHFHLKARQFFYVLTGSLTMELDGLTYSIPARAGIEIPPGARHQARNESAADVHFLVISSPTTRGDRIDVD